MEQEAERMVTKVNALSRRAGKTAHYVLSAGACSYDPWITRHW